MFNPPSNEEDFSFDDLIQQSDREIKRLGWTKEQGRDYLVQAYGKRSRLMLLDEELIGFLQYLKSLPTLDISGASFPITTQSALETPFDEFDENTKQLDSMDMMTQITIEIERLGWTSEQGRAYLLETYRKRSRHLLNDEELREFLQYLKSLPTSDISNLSSVSTLNRETQFFDESSKQIDIEIKRLNWTEEQESEYLLKTYGKRSRFMLPDQELSEFLSYLKSLPISTRDRTSFSFDELIKQSDIEIKRLGWTKEQGRDYLLENYGKRARLMLTDVELPKILGLKPRP